jgi:ParB-like chromosome segregation protein Spo0J
VSALLPADSPRRSGEDEAHVRRLAECADSLPPLLVHRPTMRVVDGMHRLRAAHRAGCERVEVEFFDGTEEEAFARAVELNVTHGLPLSLADRKAAAARILTGRPWLSDRAVAATTGLAATTVAAIRARSTAAGAQSNERTGQDGRVRPTSGTEGRRRAVQALRERPGAPLREIAATAGIAVSTAHEVRKLLRAGEDPVRDRRTTRPGSRDAAPAPPRPVAERAGLPPAPGVEVLLERLRRDPSLRLSEAGRNLLGWLHAHLAGLGGGNALVEGIPPHCLPTVALLARQGSAAWLAFARDIEQRNGTGSEPAAPARWHPGAGQQ